MTYDDDTADEFACSPAGDYLARLARWIGLLIGLIFLAYALLIAL